MASLKMKTELRENIGTNVAKKLRANKVLPAVVYKRGEETLTIQVDEVEFLKVFRAAGRTNIIELEVDGRKEAVIVKEVQRHPVKNQIIHIDFQGLNMDEAIRMNIPINLLNKDNIRLQPSILSQMLDQVEIECLPGHIPNTADIDVIDMQFNDPKYVRDLDIANDEKITILTDLDTLICTLSEPSLEEEEEDLDADTDVDVEVPVIGEEEEE